MHIDTLRGWLADRAKAIGYGRFSLTINAEDGNAAASYVTHWWANEFTGSEDCKAICIGTLADCMDAVEAYVANPPPRKRKMRPEDIGLPPLANAQAAE